MKLEKTLGLAGICIAVILAPTSGLLAKKSGGGGNAGSGNGGDPEPVYTASGDLIEASEIDSTNLNFDDIIFRPGAGFTLNLSAFGPLSDPDSNGECPWSYSANTTGTLVLGPGDSASDNSARLRFGFQGQLSNNGETVQYYFNMQGSMTGDWPPTDVTTLEFSSWDISAENRKSQKSDCQGDGVLSESVIIGVAAP